MAEEADEAEEQQEIESPKKQPKGPYRYLLLIVIIMLLETTGAYIYLNWAVPAPEVVEEELVLEELETQKFIPPIFYEDLAQMTFSPLETRGRNLVRLSIVLEVDRLPALDELTLKHMQVWDMVLQKLEQHTIEQLRDPDRQDVKDALTEVINKELVNGDVTGVFFTDFIMQ